MIKKILLQALGLALCTSAFAQENVQTKAGKPTGTEPHTVKATNVAPKSSKKTRAYGNNGVIVGTTTYDLQTNGSMSRRIIRNDQGLVSAVWTFSASEDGPNVSAPYPDRGTGYNTFNGSAWGSYPIARREAFRTGFANILENGGKEVIASHSAGGNGTANSHGLFTHTNASTGNNTFTLANTLNTGVVSDTILWAKTAESGTNIYMIGCNSNSTDSTKTGLKFTKSSNGGATWSPLVDMPGLPVDSIFRITADAYNIDARGTKVAVVVGDILTNGYIVVSNDNGATWSTQCFSRTGLFPGQNPFNYQTIPEDSIEAQFVVSTDGTQTVHIKNDGTVGVMYTAYAGLRDSSSQAGSYFPSRLTNFSLVYWESSMPTDNIRSVDAYTSCDEDTVFTLGTSTNIYSATGKGASYAGLGTNNYPTMTETASGDTLFVIYAAQMDADTTSLDGATGTSGINGQSFRDIMVACSFDKGLTWSKRVNLSNTPGYEEMFPSVAKNTADGNLHILWHEDAEPGTMLQNGDNFSNVDPVRVKYLKMPIADVVAHAVAGDLTCWNSGFIPASINTDVFGNPIFNVYPNPAENLVTVEGNIQGSKIVVMNTFGQVVNAPIVNQASDKAVINIADLPTGIYNATIFNGKATSVIRFVKK
jgi:hypothetical protein